MDIETFEQVVSFLSQHYKAPVMLGEGNSIVAISPHLAGRVVAVTSEGREGINPLFTKKEAMINPNLNLAYDPEGGHRWWVVPEGQRDWSFYLPVGETNFEIDHLNEVWKVPPYFDKAAFNITRFEKNQVALTAFLRMNNVKGNIFDMGVDLNYSLVEVPKFIEEQVTDFLHIGYTQEILFENIGKETWDEEYGMIAPWSLDMLKSGNSWIILPVKKGTIDQVIDYKMSGPAKNSEVESTRFLRRGSYGLFRADGRYRGKLGLRANIAKEYIAAIDLDNGLLTVMNVPISLENYVDNRWVPEGRFGGTVIDCYNDSGNIAGGGPVSMFELEGVSSVKVQKPGEKNLFMVTARYFKTDPSNIEILYNILNRMVGVDLRKETYKA